MLEVCLPPLRDRDNDAVLLAHAFTDRYCHNYHKAPMVLAPGVADWLVAQQWPGNVRELENLVHRAVVLSDGPALDFRPEPKCREGDPDRSVNALTSHSFREAKERAIANFEREYIIELLARTHGNLSLAARVSGKERSRLGRLLKKYGMTRDSFIVRETMQTPLPL